MPYHEHDCCATPPDETVVWRYIDIPKLIDLLEQRSLWLSPLDRLDDPREGRATTTEFEQIRLQKYGKELIGMNEGMRSEGCVNCWFEGPIESMAMWQIYGRGSYAVAIKSTIGSLKKAVSEAVAPVYISRMEYVDWNDHARWPGNAIAMALRKSNCYNHEQEVRLYALRSMLESDLGGHAVQGTPIEMPIGVRVPIEPGPLIHAVIVGPEGSCWTMELIVRLMARFGLQERVHWSNLKPVRDEY